MIGDIGNQVADIARTNGKIAATEAANEKMKTAGSDARNAAISQLKKDGKEITDQAIHDQMYQTFYNEAFNKSGMGTGQSTQRAITAATAAVQALAGGDIKAAIAGASAPYIANAIANAIPDTDLKGRVLAHAVVNAALAAASGRDAASAAAGVAVGELAGKIAVDGFGKQVNELSEEEKQTVSALATLASGLAGGLVGDSSANAVAAAQAGKTTVENNSLSVPQIESFAEKAKGCEVRGDCGQIVKEMEELSLNQQKEMIAVCSSNPKACKDKYGDMPANGMLVRKALDSLFDADVPSEMKNDISSFWAQQMEAEGVVTSTEFASQLESRYGMDKQQSEILAMAVLGAVTGGMGKGGKPGAGASGKNIVVVDSGKKGPGTRQ